MYLSKQEILKYEPQMIAEYNYLAGRSYSHSEPFPLPHIYTLIEETYRSVNNEHLSFLLKEAIDNEMHIQYGMGKREFMTKAQMMNISYFVDNKIPINEVKDQVLKFVHQYRISYINHNDEIINSPIGRGVW